VKFKPKQEKIDKAIVYAIPCECGKFYVGETGRDLKTRIKEHQNSATKDNPDLSKLTEHPHKYDHRFIFNDTRVIAREEK
jgi:predicted GIY-YIG superfamily endonuclease